MQTLNPLEIPGWDGLISSHKDATFFHSASWAGVLRDTYGHAPHYFCAADGVRLSAFLPVMEVNSLFTGRRGVSLPFTDECPFLSDGSVSAEDLFKEVTDFGKRRQWNYLECRGTKGLPQATGPSLSFRGHVLAVADRQDRIFGRFEGSVRRAIRKAERAKIQLEISQSAESLRTYHSLHCKTRRKHGLPPQSLAFFQSIFRQVFSQGMGLTVVARYQERPIAAGVFFHFADKAVYKFGASDPAFQHLRGNNLVMWEAIKRYCAGGYSSLHFGRTSMANEGLRRFKLGFGTAEYMIDYFKYDFRKAAFVAERDRVFGWFNNLFRWMPIRLSRLVGLLLYRHQS